MGTDKGFEITENQLSLPGIEEVMSQKRIVSNKPGALRRNRTEISTKKPNVMGLERLQGMKMPHTCHSCEGRNPERMRLYLSFSRRQKSRKNATIPVMPAKAGIQKKWHHTRHACEGRNPEECHYTCHSCEGRNPEKCHIPVIPAKAGIQKNGTIPVMPAKAGIQKQIPLRRSTS